MPVDATAFPNRNSQYWMMISEIWTDRSESEGRVAFRYADGENPNGSVRDVTRRGYFDHLEILRQA